MSIAELERAATAPSRWIVLSSSEDRNNDGFLPRRATRVIKNPIASMANGPLLHMHMFRPYLVPGGRYFVANGRDFVGVWDLGYVSDDDTSWDEKPTKMWATTTINPTKEFLVHPTPDGLGIRILTYSPPLLDALYVFEIYPQREAPELTKIAELILNSPQEYLYLSFNGNRVFIHSHRKRTITVWNFIANTVARWSISSSSPIDQIIKITETAVIVLHHDRDLGSATRRSDLYLWIFQIPTLTILLSDAEYSPEIAPVLTFSFTKSTSILCQKPDRWYSSLPLYFDMFKGHQGGDFFTRCRLDLASDLSNVSLTPIANLSMGQTLYISYSTTYRMCEDRAVNVFDHHAAGVSTFLTSCGTTLDFDLPSDCHDSSQTPPIHVNTVPLARFYAPRAFCPASARLVFYTDEGDFDVSDFL